MESLIQLSKELNVGNDPITCPIYFFNRYHFDRCCTVISQDFNSSNHVTYIRPIKTRHNVSLLLDKLLDNYNHHLRPDVGGL